MPPSVSEQLVSKGAGHAVSYELRPLGHNLDLLAVIDDV